MNVSKIMRGDKLAWNAQHNFEEINRLGTPNNSW